MTLRQNRTRRGRSSQDSERAERLRNFFKRPNGTLLRPSRFSLRPQSQLQAQINRFPKIPQSFDCRTQWQGLISPILDQGDCGSCYAFATCTAFTDRFAIVVNQPISVRSPQFLVSCVKNNQMLGCNGGTLSAAATACMDNSIPSLDDMPYSGSSFGDVGNCTLPGYRVDQAYAVTSPAMTNDTAVQRIQRELLSNGSVVSQMTIYEDFYDYWVSDDGYAGSVYVYDGTSANAGGHAVKIVGWGETDDGESYWTVANSWGQSGGFKGSGYFLIRRGTNEVGIELQGTEAVQLSPESAQDQLETPISNPYPNYVVLTFYTLVLVFFGGVFLWIVNLLDSSSKADSV